LRSVDVVDDLREAAQLTGLVEQRREDHVRPELGGILAYPPALALVPALDGRELELDPGIAARGVIGQEEARVVLADDLVAR